MFLCRNVWSRTRTSDGGKSEALFWYWRYFIVRVQFSFYICCLSLDCRQPEQETPFKSKLRFLLIITCWSTFRAKHHKVPPVGRIRSTSRVTKNLKMGVRENFRPPTGADVSNIPTNIIKEKSKVTKPRAGKTWVAQIDQLNKRMHKVFLHWFIN